MRRFRTICFIALGALVVLFVAAGVAWAVDAHTNDDRVGRNTTLAGRKIGGLRGVRLDAAVAAVAEKYRSSPVVVEAPEGGFTTNASDLGMSIDTDATARDALRVGHRGSLLGRIKSWVTSFAHDRKAPVRVVVDERSVRAIVDAKDTGPRTGAGGTGREAQDRRFRLHHRRRQAWQGHRPGEAPPGAADGRGRGRPDPGQGRTGRRGPPLLQGRRREPAEGG